MFTILMGNIRNRAISLGHLGMLPNMFGTDVSGLFKQKFHGNITISPRFPMVHAFGLSTFVHPNEDEMKVYLQGGQSAVWPYVR